MVRIAFVVRFVLSVSYHSDLFIRLILYNRIKSKYHLTEECPFKFGSQNNVSDTFKSNALHRNERRRQSGRSRVAGQECMDDSQKETPIQTRNNRND